MVALLRRLALLVVTTGLSACGGLLKPWSQPPALEEVPWQQETIVVEPGSGGFGTPSVLLEGDKPRILVADLAYYVGTQSTALARRDPEGWRLEFPMARAPSRLCGSTSGASVVITTSEGEGAPQAMRWDGAALVPDEAGPCPEISSRVRVAAAGGGTHELELARDGRTLWPKSPSGEACPPHDSSPGQQIKAFALAIDASGHPGVALFEAPEGQDVPGQLRHATCDGQAWRSSVIASGVRVTGVGLAIDASGRPHVAYAAPSTEGGAEAHALVYATPTAGAAAPPPPDRDARVLPAVEACERVLDQLPLGGSTVEAYQSGDPFRCAVLEREPSSSEQALAALTPRCDGGEARACLLAGSLHHWLMGEVSFDLQLPADGTTRLLKQWLGLRPKGVAEDTAEAAALYGRACDLGEARGCLYQASVVPPGDERRLALSRQACDAGLVEGCALAVVVAGVRPAPALLKQVSAPLRRACEGDDARACNALGVALHGQGDVSAARAALDRACKGSLRVACENLELLGAP